MGLVYANSVTYDVYYSTDYKFRILSMFYNPLDNNRVLFDFTMFSESTKMEMDILPDNGNYGSQPQLLFGTPPQTIFNQNHNPSCIIKDWLCEGTTESWGGLGVAYRVLKGESISCKPRSIGCSGGQNTYNVDGLTKSDIEGIGFYFNNPLFLKEIYSPFFESPSFQSYYGFTDIIDPDYHAFNFGYGGNASCGSAHMGIFSEAPPENDLCSFGNSMGSLTETFNGWTWACYLGIPYSYVNCYATNVAPPAPPIIPPAGIAPTPTDCSTYTGIENITCNFANTLQGIFLPSSEKITELQTTIYQTGNIFPFNYLRAVATGFSTLPAISSAPLTMTLFGTTKTMDTALFSTPFFVDFRLFTGLLLTIGFVFWAINYIKQFFK